MCHVAIFLYWSWPPHRELVLEATILLNHDVPEGTLRGVCANSEIQNHMRYVVGQN